MSRQRMIRPEFFTDEDLTGLPPLTRLLFIGLWTIADREGRLRDRPRTIKFTLFPADDCDVDAMLDELASVGSIVRYEVDGERYIAVPGFTTYQHCHKNEQESTIPAPKKTAFAGKHGASTVQAPNSPGTSTSTSTSTSPPIVPPTEQSENGVFDAAFWPRWPKRHGSKKLAHARFYRLSKADQARVLSALDHLIAAIDDGRYGVEYVMRAENFVGGQKRYFEEWADGPPPKYAPATSKPESRPGFQWKRFADYDERGNRRDEWREVPV